jgi:hypothetical protein
MYAYDLILRLKKYLAYSGSEISIKTRLNGGVLEGMSCCVDSVPVAAGGESKFDVDRRKSLLQQSMSILC